MALYIDKSMVDGVEELPRLTQEEFLAIPVAERPKIWVKRNATETDRGITAEDVGYDNTSSGLSATDTQGAIDEVVTSLTGWGTLETLYTDAGFVIKGTKNARLKLAIIKLDGTANFPSATGISQVLNAKYKPLMESFTRLRHSGDMWVDMVGTLKTSGMDTSKAWQNGYLLYVTSQ